MSKKIRVLCLDIEGGHGGSSISLYETVKHLDRIKVTPEVWCKKKGPIQEKYGAIGITCMLWEQMPKVTSVPRLSRNLILYSQYVANFLANLRSCNHLVGEINRRFDLVHFNHEGLFLLAWWMKMKCKVPFLMHIRTNLHDSFFARCQVRLISKTMDDLVFITEQEKKTFEKLGGESKGEVIYNVVSAPSVPPPSHPDIPNDERFKIASVSNYKWLRGTDRLVDVAGAIAKAGRRNEFLFVMAGDYAISETLPGDIGACGKKGGTLKDYVESRGLGDMFLFLGHVSDTDRVVYACDVLAKPTRDGNPWGRDILEAMVFAKPVIAVGKPNRFVVDNETGFNHELFDSDRFVECIFYLKDHPDRRREMGESASVRVKELCDGNMRASDLLRVWKGVLEH